MIELNILKQTSNNEHILIQNSVLLGQGELMSCDVLVLNQDDKIILNACTSMAVFTSRELELANYATYFVVSA